MLEDRPGSIVVETTAPRSQVLVLTERFHPGWRAADAAGERVPIRVYGDYLGCVVDAGRRRVAFTFAPASARDGLRVSLAGIGLTAAATMFLLPVRVRRARGQDQGARI